MKIGQLQLGGADRSVGLSNNQLKIIAMLAMACDHVGKTLLTDWTWLMMIGRVSFPIFAYMIAQGCQHTRHRWRYFLHLFVLALGCQTVYWAAMGSLYMSVLVTFSLSILLIYSVDAFVKTRRPVLFLVMLLAFLGAFFFSEVLPWLLPQSGYDMDYGFYGVLFPVVIYCLRGTWARLAGVAMMQSVKVLLSGSLHLWGFLALPLLALYNGERGRYKLKYLFYVFYPLHLILIYVLQMLFF